MLNIFKKFLKIPQKDTPKINFEDIKFFKNQNGKIKVCRGEDQSLYEIINLGGYTRYFFSTPDNIRKLYKSSLDIVQVALFKDCKKAKKYCKEVLIREEKEKKFLKDYKEYKKKENNWTECEC